MKKIILLLFFIPMLLSGCTASNSTGRLDGTAGEENTGTHIAMEFAGDRTYSDAGIVSVNDQGLLTFYDIQSGYEVVICSKANCTHEGASSQNPNPTCDGYVAGISIACEAYYQNKLYFVYCADDSTFLNWIFSCADSDGTNRREIAAMSNVGAYTAGCYHDGYFAFGYNTTFDEHGNELEQDTAGLYLFDLSTDSIAVHIEKSGYDCRLHQVYVGDGMLTYAYYYMKEPIDWEQWADVEFAEIYDYIYHQNMVTEIWQYDIAQGEETLLWSGVGHCEAMDYGYALIKDTALHVLSLQDGSIDTLGEESETGIFCLLDEDGIILSFGEKKYEYYHYETHEITEIGVSDFSPDNVSDHLIYAAYYTDEGLAIGYITKEDFYDGQFENIVHIKYLNQDS